MIVNMVRHSGGGNHQSVQLVGQKLDDGLANKIFAAKAIEVAKGVPCYSFSSEVKQITISQVQLEEILAPEEMRVLADMFFSQKSAGQSVG